MSSCRKDIYDASTSDSSRDGCDPDWRRGVLENASSSDLSFINSQIGCDDETSSETETRLRRDGCF